MSLGTTVGIFVLLFVLLGLMAWFGAAAWLIREVHQNNDTNKLFWSVSAPLLGIFGPIVYVVSTNSARSAAYGHRVD